MKIGTPEEYCSYHDGLRRRHRVETYAMIDGKMLAYWKPGRLPELPGGGIDVGENAVEASLREADEETGWATRNHRELDFEAMGMKGEWLYSGYEPGWFSESGWDQEIYFAATADALYFNPKENYENKYNDVEFKLYTVKEIYDGVKKYLERGGLPRLRIVAEQRLQILEKMLAGQELSYKD